MMSPPPPDESTRKSALTAGFTLIELSVVLVIIGLIVGGVLVGQDLIKAAALRAQISDFEKFNTAVNTFNLKYSCLPGDCANATSFFSSSVIQVPGAGANGNGNGILDDWSDTTGFPETILLEPALFWSELYAAGFTKCCDGSLYTDDLGSVIIGTTVPQDRLNGYGISVGNLYGRNGYYWGITTSTGVAGWSDGCGGGANYLCDLSVLTRNGGGGVITPLQAQAFDTKVDDGNPATGNVYAAFLWSGDNHIHSQTNPVETDGYLPGNCLTASTPYAYNGSYGSPACSLWINMQGM